MGSNVLLTGATGFLGSRILEMLLQGNFGVIVAKRSFSDTSKISSLLQKCKSYDLDKTPLEEIFRENKIDVVIHTATAYGRRGEKVHQMVDTNVIFPLKILELSLASGTGAFINTDTVLPPELDNYVLSKSQFVNYARALCNGKMRFVNLKLEHMYGPGDEDIKFIQFIINAMLSSQKEIPLTAGEQKRGFIYIDDVVSAFSTVLSHVDEFKLGFSELEVGSGMSYRIKDVVLLAHRLTKSDSTLKFGALPYRKNEVMESRLDNSNLKALGWNAAVGLEEGMKKTVEWAKGHRGSG